MNQRIDTRERAFVTAFARAYVHGGTMRVPTRWGMLLAPIPSPQGSPILNLYRRVMGWR